MFLKNHDLLIELQVTTLKLLNYYLKIILFYLKFDFKVVIADTIKHHVQINIQWQCLYQILETFIFIVYIVELSYYK